MHMLWYTWQTTCWCSETFVDSILCEICCLKYITCNLAVNNLLSFIVICNTQKYDACIVCLVLLLFRVEISKQVPFFWIECETNQIIIMFSDKFHTLWNFLKTFNRDHVTKTIWQLSFLVFLKTFCSHNIVFLNVA